MYDIILNSSSNFLNDISYLMFYCILSPNSLFQIKKNKIILFCCIVLIVALNLTVLPILSVSFLSRTILYTATTSIISITIFLVSRGEKIKIIFVIYNALVFVTFIRTFSRTILLFIPIHTMGNYIFLKAVLNIIIMFLVYHFFRPIILKTLNLSIKFRYLLIIPVTVTYTFCYQMLAYFKTSTDMFFRVHTALLTVITAFLYICFLAALQNIYQARLAQTEKILYKSQTENLQRTLEKFEAYDKSMSVFRHDMRHRFQIISALLDQEKYDELKTTLAEFIDSVDQTTRNSQIHHYCNIPTLNAVLDFYSQKSRQEQIYFESKIQIGNTLPAEIIDFSIVMANLLENAMNACLQLPENSPRYITLLMKQIGAQLYIKLSNSSLPNVLFNEKGYPVTRQKDHGFGTQSVLFFAAKYNATIEYQLLDTGIFQVRLMI